MPPIKRKTWDHAAMIQAVNAVRRKEMGYLRAAKQFGVPKGTLERYVKKDVRAEDLVQVRMGRRPALPIDLEAELERYCKEMDRRFYGLRLQDIKYMAFQLAIKNNLRHPFSVTKASVGKKWLRGFLRRHPTLSIRTPEAVSAARVKGFNPVAVANFFDLYEPELDKIKSAPHRVYNVDETGITVVQHKRSKVVSMKGKKQVGALTSLERGKLMTIVTCMNACGTYVPPLIVFPRKNMAQDLMDGAPAGSIGDCHPSGWIQTHLFTKWFQHFINFTKPSKDDPVLLVLDGHYTHTRNIDLINLARDNNVIIVCLPPHCTHRMQPMDVAFMKPLKAYYSQEIETWLRNNSGRTLTNKYVARLFGAAYEKAATMTNSVNGFRKAGLFPCNRHIFTDEEFSIFNDGDEEQDLLNVQRNDENADLEDTSYVLTSIENQSEPTEILPNSGITNDNPSDEYQGLASSKTASTASVYDNPVPSTSSSVSPFALKPVPRLPKNNSSSKKTRTGAASIITASPYKKSLEESLNKKQEKENKKGQKKQSVKKQQTMKKNLLKRKKLKKLVPVPKTMTCLSWQIAVGMNMMLNVPTVAVTFRRIQEEKNGPNVIVVLNGLMKIVEM
ncbi:tigger transposable element-derived protein 6-like [Spodoptera litura]|uniref:Tigger transposable element-derived protein 6-like n=1 Tax=Spodoptera litura TaxID=69820 RepID=A0A9J7ITZ1_SPOLT|nr:tigger transposable element-derived protein 6-like [Spodoptera litura]